MSPSPPLAERELGRIDGAHPGRTVVLTGGVHGNEPAGVEAARRVLDALDPSRVRGRIVALRGNRAGLAAGRRFIERDLNRGWSELAIQRLRALPLEQLEAEDREQAELLERFEALAAAAEGPVIFLDLHTMSGPGAPFVCMADVLRNRPYAFGIGAPLVLGLEEVIEGSMLGWLCDQGHVGVAVEGGQHEDPVSVLRSVQAILSVLVQAGSIEADAIPADLGGAPLATKGIPRVMEIRHRHVCREDDGFEMAPGFANFQPIRKGQVLASDHRGRIHAPMSGILLLPRYQGTGEDGFFVARPVRARWLQISAYLRRFRLERVLRRLPGVRCASEGEERYLVDPRWASRPMTDVFHLLGFRRVRTEGAHLAFSRRRQDG